MIIFNKNRTKIKTMKTDSHKLITVRNAQFLHKVQIAQSKLEIENYASFITNKHLTSVDTTFVEGYKLQVDSAIAVQAKTNIDSISE